MTENIRLVIWDLDETFWHGTVTEGGHVYNQTHHDIVVSLATRGIISSVCSKNDFAAVKEILVQRGIWEYFVFPSISWEPKGPRLAALVQTVQLRAETIVFIDDNAMNRSEAQHFVPGIQVASETSIGELLSSPLLQGKTDAGLTRLAQYKILERRQQDRKAPNTDIVDFLKLSKIKVTIDHDVEAKIERAVELINRTNQLNFTKVRLSEDADTAANDLTELLSRYNIQAGFVCVEDVYGNYGECGFYAVQNFGSQSRLIHFCFSCRILNMGVERWTYHRIGRPQLHVVGDVLTDIHARDGYPDWINMYDSEDAKTDGIGLQVGEVLARGGCNIASLMHYFQAANVPVTGELNVARNGIEARKDHSIFLRYAILGVSEADEVELGLMGFKPEDYQTALLKPQMSRPLWLLSFWSDADFALYRHKKSGLRIPFSLHFPGRPHNLTNLRVDQLPPHLQTPVVKAMVERLTTEYEMAGVISEELFKENLRLILDRAPSDALIFILGINESKVDESGNAFLMPVKVNANQRMRDVAATYANVFWLDTASFSTERERLDPDPNHLSRVVYYRMFQHIKSFAERHASTSQFEAASVN